MTLEARSLESRRESISKVNATAQHGRREADRDEPQTKRGGAMRPKIVASVLRRSEAR